MWSMVTTAAAIKSGSTMALRIPAPTSPATSVWTAPAATASETTRRLRRLRRCLPRTVLTDRRCGLAIPSATASVVTGPIGTPTTQRSGRARRAARPFARTTTEPSRPPVTASSHGGRTCDKPRTRRGARIVLLSVLGVAPPRPRRFSRVLKWRGSHLSEVPGGPQKSPIIFIG